MEVRKFNLLPGGVTVVEVLQDGQAPWSFAPFDDQLADISAVDDRFVVALGKPGGRRIARVGVFDAHTRSTIASIQSAGFKYQRGFAYAAKHRAIFVPDSSGAPHPHLRPGELLDGVRRIDLDGGGDRFILLAPGFYISHIIARADGSIVCIGNGRRMAVLDPETDAVELSEPAGFITAWQNDQTVFKLRWFSPDGWWALRAHLGSVVTYAPTLLERLSPRSRGSVHPDLATIKGPAYGVSLDLYRLDPFHHERRLVLRYLPPPSAALAAELDRYARLQDWRTWDGRSQLFFTREMSDEDRAARRHGPSPEQQAVAFLTGVKKVDWEPDSAAFVATFVDGSTRRVTLEGQVGPIRAPAPRPKYDMQHLTHRSIPSEKAIERIRRELLERATVRVRLEDGSPAGLAKAVSDMADRMDEGLAGLVFNDALQFVVLDGRKRLNEKRFFKLVRALGREEAQGVIPPLRRLLESYGRQAAERDLSTSIMSGFSESPGVEHAALSEAALALAELDMSSVEVLRGWFESVDQEHDYFAAEKVLPAIRKVSGFGSVAGNRFGLWFLMYQWQTTTYDPFRLGIVEDARKLFTPDAFVAVVIEEASSFSHFDGFKDADLEPEQHRIEIIRAQLEPANPWDEAAMRALGAATGR